MKQMKSGPARVDLVLVLGVAFVLPLRSYHTLVFVDLSRPEAAS